MVRAGASSQSVEQGCCACRPVYAERWRRVLLLRFPLVASQNWLQCRAAFYLLLTLRTAKAFSYMKPHSTFLLVIERACLKCLGQQLSSLKVPVTSLMAVICPKGEFGVISDGEEKEPGASADEAADFNRMLNRRWSQRNGSIVNSAPGSEVGGNTNYG